MKLLLYEVIQLRNNRFFRQKCTNIQTAYKYHIFT